MSMADGAADVDFLAFGTGDLQVRRLCSSVLEAMIFVGHGAVFSMVCVESAWRRLYD